MRAADEWAEELYQQYNLPETIGVRVVNDIRIEIIKHVLEELLDELGGTLNLVFSNEEDAARWKDR